MKKRVRNSIIILAITVFMLWFLLKDNYSLIMDAIFNASFPILLVALLCYIIHIVFDVLNFHEITKLYTNKLSFRYQLYLGLIYRFFCGITPLATGGQPFQVYELHKKGLSYSSSTNIAVQSYMIFQVALIVFGIATIIINNILRIFSVSDALKTLTIIGFVINFIILLLLILVCFSKDFNRKIVNFFINIFSKIKLIKDKEATRSKWEKVCDDYYNNARMMLKNKKTVIKGFIFQLISLLGLFTVPLFVAYSIGIYDINVFAVIAGACFVYIMGCYVPIPGATGGMEYAFLGFFAAFVDDYRLSVMLILWRVITYYLPTLVGAVLFNLFHSSDEKDIIS